MEYCYSPQTGLLRIWRYCRFPLSTSVHLAVVQLVYAPCLKKALLELSLFTLHQEHIAETKP